MIKKIVIDIDHIWLRDRLEKEGKVFWILWIVLIGNIAWLISLIFMAISWYPLSDTLKDTFIVASIIASSLLVISIVFLTVAPAFMFPITGMTAWKYRWEIIHDLNRIPKGREEMLKTLACYKGVRESLRGLQFIYLSNKDDTVTITYSKDIDSVVVRRSDSNCVSMKASRKFNDVCEKELKWVLVVKEKELYLVPFQLKDSDTLKLEY